MAEIKRDAAGTPLVQVSVRSSRGMDTVAVTVNDCEKENITVQMESLIRGKESPDTVCTALPADLRAIKELCSDPVLFAEVEEEPFPGIYVEDGNSVSIQIFGKDKDADFSFLNLWSYENCLDDAPQTKRLYQIAEKVLKAASKASGKKLKLDMFT